MNNEAATATNEIDVVVQASNEYVLEELMMKYKTKSAVIRFLNAKGWKRTHIASFLNIKYQFVRNVLTQPTSQKQLDEVTE